jgi:hypothetical protein
MLEPYALKGARTVLKGYKSWNLKQNVNAFDKSNLNTRP